MYDRSKPLEDIINLLSGVEDSIRSNHGFEDDRQECEAYLKTFDMNTDHKYGGSEYSEDCTGKCNDSEDSEDSGKSSGFSRDVDKLLLGFCNSLLGDIEKMDTDKEDDSFTFEDDNGHTINVEVMTEYFSDSQQDIQMIVKTPDVEEYLFIWENTDCLPDDEMLSMKGKISHYINELVENNEALKALMFGDTKNVKVKREGNFIEVKTKNADDALSAIKALSRYTSFDEKMVVVTFPTKISIDVQKGIVNSSNEDGRCYPSHIVNSGDESFIQC